MERHFREGERIHDSVEELPEDELAELSRDLASLLIDLQEMGGRVGRDRDTIVAQITIALQRRPRRHGGQGRLEVDLEKTRGRRLHRFDKFKLLIIMRLMFRFYFQSQGCHRRRRLIGRIIREMREVSISPGRP